MVDSKDDVQTLDSLLETWLSTRQEGRVPSTAELMALEKEGLERQATLHARLEAELATRLANTQGAS